MNLKIAVEFAYDSINCNLFLIHNTKNKVNNFLDFSLLKNVSF